MVGLKNNPLEVCPKVFTGDMILCQGFSLKYVSQEIKVAGGALVSRRRHHKGNRRSKVVGTWGFILSFSLIL